MSKFTQAYLDKLVELTETGGYKIRNEKGNFKSGSCLLRELKVIVLNKFATVEARTGFLIEAIQQIDIDESLLDDKQRKMLAEVKQTVIDF